MIGNQKRMEEVEKGNLVTISGKALRSAEQKRLQHGGGTGKGLEDCGKASIGVRGSTESQGRDSIPLLGPEPLRAIVHVDTVWTSHGRSASIVAQLGKRVLN